MVHETYDANRCSPLDQNTAANVAGLKLAFAVPLGRLEPAGFGVGGQESTRLVDNGCVYISDLCGTPCKIKISSGTAVGRHHDRRAGPQGLAHVGRNGITLDRINDADIASGQYMSQLLSFGAKAAPVTPEESP